MGFRERAKGMKEEIIKRHNEQIEKSGRTYGSIFDRDKFPKTITNWKINEGEHIIDVIPWITSENHPFLPKNSFCYLLDVLIHTGVGVTEDVYVCPAYNFKQRCPICEYISKRRLPKEEWNQVKAKRYGYYFVWVQDNEVESAKGVRLMSMPHYSFQMHVDAQAKGVRGGGSIPFADPDVGKNVVFTRQGSGKDNTRYMGHKFADRLKPVPDSILDQAFPMEDYVIWHPSYEEMAEVFYAKKGGAVEKQDEPPKQDEPQSQESASGECPVDAFGRGLDKYPECNECESWDACLDAFKKTRKRFTEAN